MTLEETIEFLEHTGIEQCNLCLYKDVCKKDDNYYGEGTTPPCMIYDLEDLVDITLLVRELEKLEGKK